MQNAHQNNNNCKSTCNSDIFDCNSKLANCSSLHSAVYKRILRWSFRNLEHV